MNKWNEFYWTLVQINRLITQFYLISEIIQQLKMNIEIYSLSKDLYEKRDDLITEMRVLKPHIIK